MATFVSHFTAFASAGTVPLSSLSPRAAVPPQNLTKAVWSTNCSTTLPFRFERHDGQPGPLVVALNAPRIDCSQDSSSNVLPFATAFAALTWHPVSFTIVRAAAFATLPSHFALFLSGGAAPVIPPPSLTAPTVFATRMDPADTRRATRRMDDPSFPGARVYPASPFGVNAGDSWTPYRRGVLGTQPRCVARSAAWRSSPSPSRRRPPSWRRRSCSRTRPRA